MLLVFIYQSILKIKQKLYNSKFCLYIIYLYYFKIIKKLIFEYTFITFMKIENKTLKNVSDS